MKTHNLLLSSVAALALSGAMATAQTIQTMDADEAGVRLESAMTDDDGRMVDAEGNLIDEEGFFADAEGVRIEEGGEAMVSESFTATAETETTGVAAMGGQVVVEQADPSVSVEVPDPQVTVDQAQPEVLVEQAEPQITVTVAEPTVTVEQQAPIITIEQAQPEVTVSIPEPVITVRMPEPDVNVATAEPQVQVEQPEPVVRFVRPEPRITIEEAEPNVQVTSAEPEVRVNRADAAAVTVDQAEANVEVEQEGEGAVQLTEADPVVNVEQAEGADVQVEQAEAAVNIEEQEEANVIVTDQANMAEPAEPAATTEADVTVTADAAEEINEGAGGLYATFAESRVSDLVGMDVLSTVGNEVGEVDRLIRVGSELMAVVGVGGFLGLGEHDVAIPLDRFNHGQDDNLILEGLTEEELESMPEWDETGEVMPLGMTVREAY